MAETEKPSLLDASHPYAPVINGAVVYVTYLFGLGAGFWLDFSPPLSGTWVYGALFFGGLVITLLLQMKFARRIWSRKSQNLYLTIAALGLLAVFVIYVILRNAFIMDYGGRDVVIGWSLLPEWPPECAREKAFEVTQCVKFFGDKLEGSARADAFFGRAQIVMVITALQLAYCFMAFALIFAITGLIEMLRAKK